VAFADIEDTHPASLLTVKLYTPPGRPVITVVVPEPLEVIVPGYRIIVQVPVAGNPVRATLPPGTRQVGEVIVPISGAAGIVGCGAMTMLSDDSEVHPKELETV
jgi:hypothetical protein